MKKYLKLFAIPIILALIAYQVQGVAENAYNTFANGTSYFQTPIQEGEGLEPLAKYVLIVVYDSLRFEDSLKLENLNRMREKGAGFISYVGEPSYSLPGYSTIPTGAFPEITGVTSNYFEGKVFLDNIFQAAKDSGLTTGIVSGSDAWLQEFGEYLDFGYSFEPEKKDLNSFKVSNLYIKEKSVEVIQTYKPNLLLVHFVGSDEASHKYGGNSSEYHEIAIQQDNFTMEILKLYNLDETVVFVTADHGHIDTGGHGGWEEKTLKVPLVIYGANIKKTKGEAKNTDIAPTVSAILGIRIPTHSQGSILFDAVNVSEKDRAQKLIHLAKQQKIFTEYYIDTINVKKEIDSELLDKAINFFDEENYKQSITNSEKFIETTVNIRKEARREKILEERLERVPLSLSIVFLPLLIAFFAIKNRWLTKKILLIAIFSGFSYILLFNITFFSLGNTYSLSTINDDPDIEPFFNMIAILGVFLPLFIMAIVGIYLRKWDKYEIVKTCWVSSAVISYFVILQLDFHYLLQNNGISWYIPNMMLAFKFYIDAMQYIPMGYTSILHPFIALTSGIFSRKIWR